MTSGPVRRSSGEVQFDSVYDDRKGKTKASNVTGGSGGTRDFGAPTSRHHLGEISIKLFAGRASIHFCRNGEKNPALCLSFL